MPASTAALRLAPEPDSDLALRYYTVTSADGTELEAWTNDVAGPTILLCNGLGTNPFTWPALLDPDCGVRVISWNHRGVGRSERPADPERVGIEVFVEDAIAVLDDAGVDACVVVGWSIGVNTMFTLAAEYPNRVTGLCAVAGVPGDTFGSMFAPLGLPRPIRRQLAVSAVKALKLTGRYTSLVTTRLPIGTKTMQVITHTGFMMPMPDLRLAARAIGTFLDTPLDWYMHLAQHSLDHGRISLRNIKVPTAFVAARYDVLASSEDMATAADRITGATYVELLGSHFIQMEKPDEVHEHLLELLDRVT